MIRKKSDPNKGGPLQLGFFTPSSDWKLPNMSDLPSWKNAKRIGIDSETKDPSLGNKMGPGDIRDGYTVGWSFCIEGGPSFYLPMRHEGGDNLPVDQVLAYLREQTKNFEGEYVGANLSYDMGYGYADGFEWNTNAKFRDVQIADPLIYELHMNFSLKEIGKRYGIESKDEAMLLDAARSMGLDPKKGLWRLPARYVGRYAEEDVISPLKLLREQEKKIAEKDLHQIWDLETDVLPALVRMRRRGVRIDFDRLERIEVWAENQEREALALIKHATGVTVGFGDVWKAGALAPALEATGMRLSKTSTGAPQIDKALLKAAGNPVADAILRARKVNKLRTTFASSIRTYAVNGRIHCSFHQIAREDEEGDQKGARYGRLSAADPNMQQQPSPDKDPEIAGEWRKIFIPEEGALFGSNDYSQQEPRWTTHFAAVMKFRKAEEAARRYREDPNTDNHEMMTRLIHSDDKVDFWIRNDKQSFKTNRGYSKNIFLGLCYGEGEAKLCHDIGLPTRWAVITGWGARRTQEVFDYRHEAMAHKMSSGSGYIKEVAGPEGREILDSFNSEVPYVKELADFATERAKSRGFIRTILGRQLNFEMKDDGSYDYTHKALNRLIQGSSADQTKLALVELDKAGYFIQLQVHDEINGSYASVEEARRVGDIMRECIVEKVKPLVPFKVDTEVGPSWGEAK